MNWLHSSIAPGLRPRVVELVDVDLVVDVHELEQVEEEERHVAVGDGGDVRHRARTGHPRVELPEIELTALVVGEEVELEVAAISLLAEPLAHPLGVSRACSR